MDVALWFDISQKIATGAVFVMGIVIYKVWNSYQKEIEYGKKRDEQTMKVLIPLSQVIADLQSDTKTDTQELQASVRSVEREIKELATLIRLHLEHVK